MPLCARCQTQLSPATEESPSLFEIDFARALLTGEARTSESETTLALQELVQRFDVVATTLLNARTANNELETSLKIARSNLVLAEANTDALEETLRRRLPALIIPSPGDAMLSRTTTPDSNLWGEPLVASPSEPLANEENGKNAISAFFRRKKTNQSSISGTSPIPPDAHVFASTISPSPSSDMHEIDSGNGGSPANGLGEERSQLNKRLEHLTALLAHERFATRKLRNSHADLVAERDKLNEAHSELQGELENLSAALFEEANRMVADERRRVAECEQEIAELRAQVQQIQGAAEGDLLSELGIDSVPTTARPTLPDSPSDSPQESFLAIGSRALEAIQSSDASDFSIGSPPVASSSEVSSQGRFPSVRHSPLATTSSPELAPGRQWLKSCVLIRPRRQTIRCQDWNSFNNRRRALRPAASQSGATSDSKSDTVSERETSDSGRSARHSQLLDDIDLDPATVTPATGFSPKLTVPDRDDEEVTATQSILPKRESAIEMPAGPIVSPTAGASNHSRSTSIESWTKRSTSSSFASPNIETALLSSPPLPQMPRFTPSPRRPERSPGRRSAPSPRSPRSTSLPRKREAGVTTSQSTASRGSPSPDVASAESPVPSSSDRLEDRGYPNPARSEPLPQMATFGVEPYPARTSSARHSSHSNGNSGRALSLREKRTRMPPLEITTPPLPSPEVIAEQPQLPRAPTPKSARRGGLVLALDTAQLFPNGRPGSGTESDGDTKYSSNKVFARALGYTAANGTGVGLLKQIPRPVTPNTPMEDLDRLLEDLENMHEELALSPKR